MRWGVTGENTGNPQSLCLLKNRQAASAIPVAFERLVNSNKKFYTHSH